VTDSATIDRASELEHKIDMLTAQMAFLTEEATAQRQRRTALEELQADLTPIAMTAIERSAYALDEVEIDPSDLIQLGARVASNAAMLERSLVQLEALNALVVDIVPIVNQGVGMAIERMGALEEKGYFEFAEATIGVVDKVVTSYSKEDVEALADNVVQMLDIIKDLTQPEMLAVAQRLLDVVHRQSELATGEQGDPPGLFALAGKLRDPEIRRGMGRALDTFKAVSAQPSDPSHTRTTTENTTPMEVPDANDDDR
jgi:uncharacterized protein YjgD (DUF1641 family)